MNLAASLVKMLAVDVVVRIWHGADFGVKARRSRAAVSSSDGPYDWVPIRREGVLCSCRRATAAAVPTATARSLSGRSTIVDASL